MRVYHGMIAALLVLSSAAGFTQAPSLLDQLSAQYKLVKTGQDASGMSIIEQGTVLAIQKGGILGVAPTTAVNCPAKFENGDLKRPSAICSAMVKAASRFFTVGEKVYITKIDVNTAKGQLSVHLLDCDTCNGSQQPAYYKSQVIFQFDKGYLETASVPKVEDTIAQLLTISEGSDQNQQDQNGQNDQGQQGQDNQGQNNQGGGQAQQPQQSNSSKRQPASKRGKPSIR